MNATAERRSDQNPESAGQETELRREYGPNQGSRTGDGCEVMTENHPAVCWYIILVVVLQDCWCRTLFIQNKHLCCQPFTVKTIADGQRAKSSGNDPKRADVLAAR
ncbi:MAG: hypothetical protein Udaeo2_21580 [Candidatus Udaeobacter sp.]|nr:MAG: hypothetical protein Udaeo2_21580 [Candidatus Udaeobacter sp.]